MIEKRIVLSGAGGFGETYVRLLSACHDRSELNWVGVIDPYAEKSGCYSDIQAHGIPIYNSMEAFFAQSHADLTIICSPIAMHCQQSITAMRHGSDVLLEKPVAATMEEARQIIRVRDETACKVSISFQWCYDPVMLRLKALSDAGCFGRLRRLRSLVLWPRPQQYYTRNDWAGKKYDTVGRPVFDSISANATAHYLLNMLWLAGKGYAGVEPKQVEATLWRANKIETFDTATMCITLPDDVQALHIVSHAAGRNHLQNPMFRYEYEHATVQFGAYGQSRHDITVVYDNGSGQSLGLSDPNTDEKLTRTLRELGKPSEVVCPVEAACKHVAVMEALRRENIRVSTFIDTRLDKDMVWVPDLARWLIECYEEFHLLDISHASCCV